MRLAIVNNERSAPSPGLTGSCPACGGPVIAKCGNQRVHHWAHRGKRVCDPWWEPETEWHSNWKMKFPEGWQEVVRRDPLTGEKHVADVRTAQGLTVEFQHSHLRPEEREARESFYGDMIWVVNGRRLDRDLPRFKNGACDLRRVIAKGVWIHPFPEEIFPRNWLMCKVPVFFDFGDRYLCCLLPQHGRSYAVVLKFSRENFIRVARNQSSLLLGKSILMQVDQWLASQQEKLNQETLRYTSAVLQNLQRQAKPYAWRSRPMPRSKRWQRR